MKQLHRNIFVFSVLFAITIGLWNAFLSEFALPIWIRMALSVLIGACVGLLIIKVKPRKN